jgi:glycosyltransferase involved in cell wall biosynthesis
MRVAFDARSLSCPVLRGWDRYTVGLVEELVRQGVEVTLFHRAREPLHQPHVAALGCCVVGLPDRGGLYWEQVAVPLALWQGRYDLFHAPAEHGVPLAAPCPVVLTIHSVTLHSYAELVRQGLLPGHVQNYLGYDGRPDRRTFAHSYMKAQIARADHILVPSEFCRCEVIRFLRVAPKRVTVTPLAVHEQFRGPPTGFAVQAATLAHLRVRRPYLLYVGGYEPHKNVTGLLKAFTRVRSLRPDVNLVLVGSKALPEELPKSVEAQGLRSGRDVVFLLNLTSELTALYDAAELFVTLSWRETFCLPALEAMTRGLPVVASAWGATPDTVADAGRLVDPRDAAGAAGAVLELLAVAHPSIFRERARRASARFNWTTTAIQTLQVYSLVTGGKRDPTCYRSDAA